MHISTDWLALLDPRQAEVYAASSRPIGRKSRSNVLWRTSRTALSKLGSGEMALINWRAGLQYLVATN